jgi:hypothetical protein
MSLMIEPAEGPDNITNVSADAKLAHPPDIDRDFHRANLTTAGQASRMAILGEAFQLLFRLVAWTGGKDYATRRFCCSAASLHCCWNMFSNWCSIIE